MLCCCQDCWCSVVAKIVGDEDDDYDDKSLMTLMMMIYNLMKWELFLPVHPARYLRVILVTKGTTSAMEMMKQLYLQRIHPTNIMSVLDCLRRPTASELAHKRKIDRNLPKGKKRCRGTCVSDPNSITPQQWVKSIEFSNNSLYSFIYLFHVWISLSPGK